MIMIVNFNFIIEVIEYIYLYIMDEKYWYMYGKGIINNCYKLNKRVNFFD